MSKEESNTRAVPGDYKGSPTFSIFEFKGESQSQYPIVGFGVKKAKAILAHIEELKDWVDKQKK